MLYGTTMTSARDSKLPISEEDAQMISGPAKFFTLIIQGANCTPELW